jgi:hypothetical protein
LISKKFRQNRKEIVISVIIMAAAVFIYIMLIFSSGINTFNPQSSACASENNPEKIKHILYINSYHPGYRWSDQVQAGIADTLNNQTDIKIDLNVEYLDGKRYSKQLEEKLGDEIASVWKRKYRADKFELIIVSDQDAYNLLARFRKSIFPGAPLCSAV